MKAKVFGCYHVTRVMVRKEGISRQMTPEKIIKMCDEQIAMSMRYGTATTDILLIMPGKWGKKNTRRLCKDGPIGRIVSDNFDERGIAVLFDAVEVKNYLKGEITNGSTGNEGS